MDWTGMERSGAGNKTESETVVRKPERIVFLTGYGVLIPRKSTVRFRLFRGIKRKTKNGNQKRRTNTENKQEIKKGTGKWRKDAGWKDIWYMAGF